MPKLIIVISTEWFYKYPFGPLFPPHADNVQASPLTTGLSAPFVSRNLAFPETVERNVFYLSRLHKSASAGSDHRRTDAVLAYSILVLVGSEHLPYTRDD